MNHFCLGNIILLQLTQFLKSLLTAFLKYEIQYCSRTSTFRLETVTLLCQQVDVKRQTSNHCCGNPQQKWLITLLHWCVSLTSAWVYQGKDSSCVENQDAAPIKQIHNVSSSSHMEHGLILKVEMKKHCEEYVCSTQNLFNRCWKHHFISLFTIRVTTTTTLESGFKVRLEAITWINTQYNAI